MPIIINGDTNANPGGVAYGVGGNTLGFGTAGTAGQVLVSGGTSAPTWAAVPVVNLATGVTGTLPIANGGTNSTATPTAGTVPYGTGTAIAYTAAGTAGQVLTSAGASVPTWATPTVYAGGDATNNIGYLNIPQNSQSAAYTLVLSDSGKSIYHPSADTTARIWTIPANASVAFPIGTAVTFINDTSAGVITIAITSDTLVLAGAGTTGSRTLAANGMATAIKMTSTRWMISGSGLT